MPGTAGQTAGDANANAEDPAEKPVEPYYPDPRGEPGVAETAEAEAEAAKQQRQEELRAEADALDDDAEEVVDLNQAAGAPTDAAPEETEPERVPKKAKASK